MPRETVPGERRVALVPEAVGRLTKAGTEVVVESGAGTGSGHDDEAYRKAGAVVGDRSAAFGADVVVKVQKPSAEEIALLREGATLVATIQPLTNADTVRALASRRTTAISMD
ncbi:MAG TPA: NAD(P)(+) transhydrogenase (Re/Si-specific) subunit alpha, partial [Candidatus Limnocylindria bacterium]